jgi:hypothetical protein
MRLPPVGVIGHHPDTLFTRVITAGLSAPATIRDGTGSGVSLDELEHAEFAGAGNRLGAVLNAEFSVQGALVGFHGVQ